VWLTIMALTGCMISATRPLHSEIKLAPPLKNGDVIRFFFYPSESPPDKRESETPLATLPIEAALFQQYLEKYSKFSTALLSPGAPAKGSYVVISKTAGKSNMFGTLSCVFGAVTLFVLPCYDSTPSSSIRYDFYIDDQIKKTYRSEIKRTDFLWWGAIPFYWVNYFTTSYKESYETTVLQLFVEAIQDGYP
jgi:hypothetical protein